MIGWESGRVQIAERIFGDFGRLLHFPSRPVAEKIWQPWNAVDWVTDQPWEIA
jgi:hypothetical protein